MTAEDDRTRLIGEIAQVLRECPVPDDARAGALTFIGWLARRMPGEPVSMAGVHTMVRRAERRQVRVTLVAGDDLSRSNGQADRPPRTVR